MHMSLINHCRWDPNGCVDRVAFSGPQAAWVKLAGCLAVFLLCVVVGFAQSSARPDPTNTEFAESLSAVSSQAQESERRTAHERQERFRIRVAIPDAVGDEVATDFAVKNAADESVVRTAAQSSRGPLRDFHWSILILALLLLAGILSLRKFILELLGSLQQQLSPPVCAAAGRDNSSPMFRAEEEGVTAFFTALQAGPPVPLRTTARMAQSSNGDRSGATSQDDLSAESGAVKEFQSRAIKLLALQRSLLQEINRASDALGRHKMLAALRWEMHILKSEAGLPWLLPVWQVASALEGLLKQLTDKPANVTASTLRTVKGGVDMLESLCMSGGSLFRLNARPIKLLVVDNHASSYNSVARALKRAFPSPDMAGDMGTALTLAAAKAYDVIFLDLQTPGTDAAKFCSEFRDSNSSRSTAVVFVTDQADYDVRAESAVSDHSDLIAKPFLTFEITLKALTLALRRRLMALTRAEGAGRDAVATEGLLPGWAITRSAVGENSPLHESCHGRVVVSS